MSGANYLNMEIAQLFGIPLDRVSEFTIHCKAFELPVVTIKQNVISDSGFKEKSTRYTLTDAKELKDDSVPIYAHDGEKPFLDVNPAKKP